MKKIKYYLITFLAIILITPININAKTLGDLKKENDNLQSQYDTNNQKKKQNQEDITSTKNRIDSIYNEIEEAQNEIQNINDDIEKLNISIDEKNDQVKELMKFFEVSEGESVYLEYIFKAESITDFIYRLSVTEQLSSYNNKLIDEMNDLITKNKENIVKLHEEEEGLKDLQDELRVKLVSLNEEKEALDDEEETLEQDLEYQRKIIDYFIKSGCKEDEDISSCARDQLPAGTRFWRPLQTGLMYSTWRSDTYSNGTCRVHAGVDIAANYGTPIYSISDGKVVAAEYSGDGYGNKVIIYHNINGNDYSSLYGHMSSINVNVGDIVTKDTVIGYVGSTGHSYGNHLHLNVCVGHTSCAYWASTSDPGAYINFPANKVWFYDRTTYYSGYYSNPCHY